MQEPLTQDLTNLDYSKISSLHQKRTLAFVNHFVATNVQFLNNFLRQCESKLIAYERKLEKVEATMILLEARLSSIPEINEIKPEPEQILITNEKTEIIDQPDIGKNKDSDEQSSPQANESNPEYDRFVKMVQVGVPLQAVKLKVSLEGLDPHVLEQIINR